MPPKRKLKGNAKGGKRSSCPGNPGQPVSPISRMNTSLHYHMGGLGRLYGLGVTDPYLTTAGSGVMAVAPATGPAAPFVAAAGAVISLLGQLGVGAGCGPTCIAASNDAN